MSHPNEDLIANFYRAFQERQTEVMAAAYSDDATFSDPVFPSLDADGVRDMWRMLGEADDLRIEASEIEADDDRGSARWDAWYTFTATGKKVHNIIHASFEFRDGKIVRHVDEFGFHRWSKQALGLPGLLLGWTPMLQKKVQRMAGARLAKWRSRRG